MFDSSLRHQKPNEINKLRSRLVRLFCFLTLHGTAGTPNQLKNSENPRLSLHRQTSHRSPAQIKPKNSSAPCRDLFDDNFQNSDVPRLARSATLAAGSATEWLCSHSDLPAKIQDGRVTFYDRKRPIRMSNATVSFVPKADA